MAKTTSWVHRYTSRELMDDGFDLFKERALDLLIAGLLPGCLIAIYWVLVRTFVFQGNLLPENFQDLFPMWEFWVYIVVLPLLAVIPIALSMALILQCRITARHILGDDDSIIRATNLLAKPIFSLFIVSIVFNLMQFAAGLVASVVSGIFTVIFSGLGMALNMGAAATGGVSIAGMILSFIGSLISVAISLTVWLGVCALFLAAPVSLACEHTGPFRAIGQSFNIAQSNFKSHFMALLVVVHAPIIMFVLLSTISGGIYALLQNSLPLSLEIIIALFTLVLIAASTGLLSCLGALAYVDGRCRRDMLDLHLLAIDIGLGETFARLYTPDLRMARAHYPNYAGAPGQSAVMPAPNYAAPPPGGPPPASAYPDYSAPPPLLGRADAPPASVYPDYSAPPPLLERSDAPPASAHPDYSAPPPRLEPADAPPPEPAGWAETDGKREDANAP